MTFYGTIPADSSTPSSSLSPFLVRAKERIQSSLADQRPWEEMVQVQSFNLPPTLGNSFQRIRTNVAFFRINYAIVVSFILFVSLLWTPISLAFLVLVVLMWLFLYFLHDGPLVVFGRLIDDGVIVMVLLMSTVAILFLTNATDNITVGLGMGTALILPHGALRSTEDSFPGGDDSATLFHGSGAPLPLKNPASPSFTSSS